MSQRWHSRRAVRLGTLLFPPAGLVLLWRSFEFSVRRKIFGTFGVILFSIPWSAAVLFLMVKFCGLQVEFTGGMVPGLTFQKTLPNYAALEASRARQKSVASPTHQDSISSSYWNGFRGPIGDGVYHERALRTNWPARGLDPVWRQPSGGGYASFAIARGKAFTIEQRRQYEAVVAYDVATGNELWTNSWLAEFQES